jgi:hypothetical protein
MRKSSVFAMAALLLLAGVSASWAAAGGAKKKKAKSSAEDDGGGGIDKKRFEDYLKDRMGKIKSAQDARMKFFADEQTGWKSFWDKIADDRKKFEVRMTRQMLDMFESLASLDPKDHATTVSNFEKMQADFMKSFETQQKQKIQDFFATQQQRWSDFAADQEKERADFMAEAQSGWEDNKSALLGQTDPAAEGDEAPKSSKPAARVARKPHPAKNPALNATDDKWH